MSRSRGTPVALDASEVDVAARGGVPAVEHVLHTLAQGDRSGLATRTFPAPPDAQKKVIT